MVAIPLAVLLVLGLLVLSVVLCPPLVWYLSSPRSTYSAMTVSTSVLRILPPVAAVLVALWGERQWTLMRTDLGFSKELTFFDGENLDLDHPHEGWNCTLLETPTAVEGLSALGDGHCVLGGGGAAHAEVTFDPQLR